MSNPGVLILSRKKLSNGKEIRIEDNIGEAIHIHYGSEWRVDLTIEELLELDRISENCLNDLLKHTGFDSKYFDPIFLDMISDQLINLEKVKFEKVFLSKMLVKTKGFLGLPVIRTIDKSRVIKALKGNTKELNAYQQENFHGQTNLDRVKSMQDCMKKIGYPANNEYIVLFNNQNVIRDGQHRAACLFHEKGDIEVQIIRMMFKDNYNNISMHPWLSVFFYWDKKRIKNILRKIYRKSRRLLSRVYRKVFR